ncbi:hypothetical protein CK203_046802 [Vitis vinifera]|uniref:Uncharacterized protein n=1 Tax=Vitis vinifera TaxID=29760 RepID=A0A438HYD3_VITVI|nr:hypothetical protein CK203_046802 [Vitis vinifera]
MSPPRRDKEHMDEKEGKQKITSPKRLRGPTLKLEIAKKISEGVKIDIQYNDDGSRKPIDRWVLWKLARLKKCEYDDVTRPVAKKIDELAKAVKEGKLHVLAKRIFSL